MRANINNIENVEGEYHVMFFEGKNMVEAAKNELRYAWFSLLFFSALLLIFIIVSGFNLYYVGFLGVFLIAFLLFYIFLKREKHRGVKQCVYAVQKSKTTDIVAKQVDNRRAGRALVRSMSGTLDRYDVKEKYPKWHQKIKRRLRHEHIVDAITQFEEENKKRKAD